MTYGQGRPKRARIVKGHIVVLAAPARMGPLQLDCCLQPTAASLGPVERIIHDHFAAQRQREDSRRRPAGFKLEGTEKLEILIFGSH
jgi:hypothetical protein